MKRIAFLTVLMMILTFSFAFATENFDVIQSDNSESDINTDVSDESVSDDGAIGLPVEGEDKVEPEEDETTPETPTEDDDTTDDTLNNVPEVDATIVEKSNSTIVGAIIAIVIVVVVIALAALIQKK